MMTTAIWYTKLHTWWQMICADTLREENVRDTERNLVLIASSSPRAQRASAGDRTDLTLVQVSWPCGGRWNEIFLSSSLNTGKNQWALYSIGTVESILSPKNPALSHLSPFSSSPRPHNQPCVVTPGLELHSPCVQLRTIHKANRPCDDPAHFSHTLFLQIYWIGRISTVIDIPPDAVDEDTLLTWLHFVFHNS